MIIDNIICTRIQKCVSLSTRRQNIIISA